MGLVEEFEEEAMTLMEDNKMSKAVTLSRKVDIG